MTKLSWICFVVLFAFAFSACDENGGKGGGGVSEVIGPEGGTITSRDGRLTLTFPPGALSEDTEITIKEIDPNDLPPEFDGIVADSAYQLEPDGLEFAVPATATLMLDEDPVQDDGALQTEGVLLLTSSDGELEILVNLTQDVNGDADTTTVSGELSHFSSLVEISSDVLVSVSGVPDVIAPGVIFDVEARVLNTEDVPISPILPVTPVTYRDDSMLQIKCLEDNCQVKLDFGNTLPHSFALNMKYVCVEPPSGIYNAEILVNLMDNNPNDSIKPDFISIFNLSKPVRCPSATPSPTPPPMEVCAKVGSYSSMSAGCGIGMFTISDITSGELTVTGFGVNPGDVKFMQLPLEPTIFSSNSDNLIIFDKNGHSCTLTCGPGEGELTLHCENPPNMCTEVFTLQ